MRKNILLLSFLLIGIISFSQDYLMTNGSVTTCSGNFYDSGGATGDYGNNENFIFTFTPATTGSMLQFNFTSFSTRNQDILYVYDGATTSAPLIGNYYGNGNNGNPGIITATNSGGILTFEFISDQNRSRSGWEASISCVFPITNNTCTSATPINEVLDLPFNTTNATASGKKPNCGGGQDPVDVWFEYTATITGEGYFDLCGSDFNTRLAIWDNCSSTTPLACNLSDGPVCAGEQSSIAWPVIAGVTYFVQVGGRQTDVGTGDLTILVMEDPQNTLDFDGNGDSDYVDCGNDPSLNITGFNSNCACNI